MSASPEAVVSLSKLKVVGSDLYSQKRRYVRTSTHVLSQVFACAAHGASSSSPVYQVDRVTSHFLLNEQSSYFSLQIFFNRFYLESSVVVVPIAISVETSVWLATHLTGCDFRAIVTDDYG